MPFFRFESVYAAKNDAAATSTITQVSIGHVASGSVPPQGKTCAFTTALNNNNTNTLNPIFNFIRCT